jgi:hypothetical protein
VYLSDPVTLVIKSPIYDPAIFKLTDDIDYTSTNYFKYLKALLLKQKSIYGDDVALWGYLYNDADLITRCKCYHDLFIDIKTNGIKTPIHVWVSDNGEICTVDGTHRTSILYALGIEETKAVLGGKGLNWCIDPSILLPLYKYRGYTDAWNSFVENVRGIPGMDILYHPVNHPWFDGWRIIRNCDDRLKIILKYLNKTDRIIDIGCHHGWFVHELTKLGFNIVGIDRRKSSIDIAKKLSKIYRLPDRFTQIDIAQMGNNVFDVALFFGTEHHIENEIGYNGLLNAISVINSIASKLIIEVATKDEELNKGNKCNPETVEKIIEGCTRYRSRGIIGLDTANRRPLFLFERG